MRYLTIPDCVDPVPLDAAREFDPQWRHERRYRWTDMIRVARDALVDFSPYSHPMSASNPEECFWLMSRYLFWMPLTSFNGPYEGVSWSASQPDFTRQAYEMFKRDLQLILYYDQKVDGIDISNCRFLLKCVFHTRFHSVIKEVFPDAVIIRLHRDPVEVAASHSSFLRGMHKGYPTRNDDNFAQIGEASLNWVTLCCNQMVSEGRDSGMIDIRYNDLIADPIDVCTRIANAVGLEHNGTVEQKLISHLEKNPKHKHGVHVYNPTDYGLNPTLIRRHLTKYCEMFSV